MQQYLDLVRTIQAKGTYKPAARENMPGTLSLFGHQFRHDLSEGFPLHTTKRMSWKILTTELMWFLNGDTNIKYLVDNGVNIWNEDAYQYYKKRVTEIGNFMQEPPTNLLTDDPSTNSLRPFTFEEFVEVVKASHPKHQISEMNYTLGDCGFQYGRVWREWENSNHWYNGAYPMQFSPVDQIAKVLKSLRENPESRRHLVTAIDPAHDKHLALYWCHSMFQFNCRPMTIAQREQHIHFDNEFQYMAEVASVSGNKERILDVYNVPKYYLDLQLYQRSADVFLGVPYNTASYALMCMLFAKMCNMIPGDFIHTFGDVHIYDNHKEAIAEQLTRTPGKLPTVHIASDFIDWSGDIDAILSKLIDEEHLSSAITLLDYQPQKAIKAELSTGLVK